jgi:hypothetical protein
LDFWFCGEFTKQEATMDNFWIYVDREGKMPQLRRARWESKTHPYYVRYVNNRPVGRHGPVNLLRSDITGTKIWDYNQKDYVPANTIPEE